MIACSTCGASNGLGVIECRMCGSPLRQSEAVGSKAGGGGRLDTTMDSESLRTQAITGGLTECLICPECQTIGQIGWLFCPQCGKEVDASFLRTTDRPDQNATIEATMSAVPAQIPLQAVAPPQLRAEEAQTAAETKPEPRSEPGAPAQVEARPPPAVMPERPIVSSGEHRSASASNPNGATANEPSVPAPSVEHVEDKVTCAECGSNNSAHYSFCLNCGESLSVIRTVVMASLPTPGSPRLRLLVQGEGSGPIYEIRNEARIGRTEGTITFPRDNFMSSSHARIIRRGADFMLIDEASSNGTFIKVKSETKLEPGDVILVGGQLLRYEP